jgi:hypothetical protein
MSITFIGSETCDHATRHALGGCSFGNEFGP